MPDAGKRENRNTKDQQKQARVVCVRLQRFSDAAFVVHFLCLDILFLTVINPTFIMHKT